YADQMAVADAEERLGVFPHVAGHPVHTISDIGMDDTTRVWLSQVLPGRVRMIGSFEHPGTGMDGMLDELARRGAEH
ncbi:terminase, partial [Rhizobium ruizarguesonis]